MQLHFNVKTFFSLSFSNWCSNNFLKYECQAYYADIAYSVPYTMCTWQSCVKVSPDMSNKKLYLFTVTQTLALKGCKGTYATIKSCAVSRSAGGQVTMATTGRRHAICKHGLPRKARITPLCNCDKGTPLFLH